MAIGVAGEVVTGATRRAWLMSNKLTPFVCVFHGSEHRVVDFPTLVVQDDQATDVGVAHVL